MSNLKMTRTIWPVGQGAFYTEHFHTDNGEFNVVFDCGLGRSNQTPHHLMRLIDVATHHFMHHSIDLIFISHFHSDHINGIKYLIDETKRRGNRQPTIVMPLLGDNLKLLYFITNIIDLSQGSPILNPDENRNLISFYHSLYFGVRGTDGEGEQLRLIDINPEHGQEGSYSSGNIFSNRNTANLPNEADWVFIPIVYIDPSCERLANAVIDALDKELVNALKTGNINSIIAQNWDDIESTINDVKRHNNANVNNVALMLYSGTQKRASVSTMHHCNCNRFLRYWEECYECMAYGKAGICNRKPAALYVGDIEKEEAWKKIQNELFNDYPFSQMIGLYQISHHGHGFGKTEDRDNTFNLSMPYFISPSYAFCCYGSENRYHHPDFKLLKSYWDNNTCTIAIDENSYALCQHISLTK